MGRHGRPMMPSQRRFPGPTRPGRRVRWLAGALVLLALAAPLAAQELQVIELHHRRAEEIIPIIKPLLDPGGVVTGTGAQLFVRTSPANLEQIRQAVTAVDRPQRQLLITVGQGSVSRVDAASAGGSATVGSGDVRVGVNRPPAAQPGARIAVGATQQSVAVRNVSTVSVLEGSETYIAVGQSVPIASGQIVTGPGGVVAQTSTAYRDVDTGFYATAYVNGDRITLEIAPRQQDYHRATGEIATRGARSTVSGRLGEWIALGAVRQADSGSTKGILVWGQRTGGDEYTAWVKVEETR
jgi:type II secretory pathway component GspD/PulD (secretin)